MKIAITSDSVCDLSPELMKKHDIKLIQISTILDGVEKLDISSAEIFEFVDKRKILPKTAALNETQYAEFFTEILKTADAVIHFNLSSQLSMCHNNAVSAAKTLKNVHIIDSLNLSTGVGMQIIYAARLRDKGLKPQEIVKRVEERRNSVVASFVIERLDFLYKGGRCSSLQLLGANLLKIRPSILVGTHGKMGMHKKYFGKMDLVITKYSHDLFKEFNTPNKDFCFITYTTATPEMLKAAREAASKMGFQTVYETQAGGTISCHCGRNTLGILYYNDGN